MTIFMSIFLLELYLLDQNMLHMEIRNSFIQFCTQCVQN